MTSPHLKRRLNVTETLPKPVRSSSSNPRAFYNLPENKPTAAQIVRESREWLQAVSTRRPCTPKDQTRSLFGSSNHDVTSRPVSAFKLSAKNFDPLDATKSQRPSLHQAEQGKRSQRSNELDGNHPSSATDEKSKPKRREATLKKFTSFDGAVPTQKGMTKSATTSKIASASSSARMKQPQCGSQQPNELQLELRGTQTKLLSHSQARLISPTFAHHISKSMLGSTENIQKGNNAAVVKSDPHNLSRSTKREESANFKRTPTPTHVRSGSRARTPHKLLDRAEFGSEAEPHLDMQVTYHQERSSSRWSLSTSMNNPQSRPNSPVDAFLQDPLRSSNGVQSAKITEPTLDSEIMMRPQKPLSGGCLGRKAITTDATLYSSPSGDSGLSSGSELDHLIARLAEFPQLLSSESQNTKDPLEIKERETIHDYSTEAVCQRVTDVEQYTRTEEEAIQIANRLYATLCESGIHERPNWSGRPMILHTVFALLDKRSAKLHIALIKIIFLLGVSGSNLVNSCKLLYGIAKDSANDALFMEHPNTLDALVNTLHIGEELDSWTSLSKVADDYLQTTPDALLFLTGTLKFLSASPVVSDRLNSHPGFIPGLQEVHQQVEKRLQILDRERSCDQKRNEQFGQLGERLYHVLVQISEIFCNLSTQSGARCKLYCPNGVMDHVIDCIIYRNTLDPANQHWTSTHQTASYLVYFNWIRLLARLTEYADACQRLDREASCQASHESLALEDSLELNDKISTKLHTLVSKTNDRIRTFCLALKNMFNWFPDNEEFVVRLAYLLGNLTARLESAREALFPDSDSLKDFCNLCYRYAKSLDLNQPTVLISTNSINTKMNAWIESKAPNQRHTNVQAGTDDKNSDVLDKLVRILANAAIGDAVGRLAVTGSDCLNLFLTIIVNEFSRGPTESLLNCLAGLNNITYYINADSEPELVARQFDIAEVLLRALANPDTHPEVLLGCIRILGNLTRQPSLRLWLVESGGSVLLKSKNETHVREMDARDAILQLLIGNLDSAQPELVYSTLGVLINMMADIDQRSSFRQLGGIARLVAALRDFAGHDWQLAGLACKTLWNYTESPTQSISELIDIGTMQELYHLLTEFTDENVVSRIHQSFLLDDPTAESDSVEIWHAAWSSEFLPVANELADRLIQQC
ncbi:armadillo repeat-containing protein 2 [Clonorchis sinensis]|uniref:Armadillo repeat-containing protein 2 n=1 Tax=Clonorchis sinensis TaxID=79923 RepID=H2KPT6_CLOSI|nr:armadillo repeat-containing protein 2 [Clonorchis sinensis]